MLEIILTRLKKKKTRCLGRKWKTRSLLELIDWKIRKCCSHNCCWLDDILIESLEFLGLKVRKNNLAQKMRRIFFSHKYFLFFLPRARLFFFHYECTHSPRFELVTSWSITQWCFPSKYLKFMFPVESSQSEEWESHTS